MKKFFSLRFIGIIILLFLFVPHFVYGADDANASVCKNISGGESGCKKNSNCFWIEGKNCLSRTDTTICSDLPANLCGPNNPIGSTVCVKTADSKNCTAPSAGVSPTPGAGAPAGSQFYAMPECALSSIWTVRQTECRDVNVLLQLIVNFGAGFFFIIGAFAFAFFIYGGFTMILSFGNAEKVKKGRDILVAAIIGLIIVFVAYIIIKFLLVDVLQVKEGFVGIK